MSLQTGPLYEFGEFCLDQQEKLLKRGETLVPVTPKVFDTLQALVQNAGRLMDKDQLMQLVWQDRFVEESNLSFNIKMLRKALGDDAANPRFIETVPRRGYRFIADVREVESVVAKPNLVSRPATPVPQDANPGSVSPSFGPAHSHSSGAVVAIADWQREPSASDRHETNGFTSTGAGKLELVRRTWQQGRFGSRVVLAGLGLAVVLIAAAIWYSGQTATAEEAPILLAQLRSEKLSADGRVTSAAISPDGDYVAYTYETDRRQSVWLRDLRSSTNVQIIPPSENRYFDLAISPDSRTVYFARVPEPWPAELQPDIYRISTLGGVPDKIISEAQGSVSLSADGTKISFRRCRFTDEDYCSLYIADSDGKNERLLLSRPRPIRIGDMAISPDGKTVAFGTGQSRNGSDDFVTSVDRDSRQLSFPS